jgi:hypothetical protein
MHNVTLDFSKMKSIGQSRSFATGFLTMFGDLDNTERSYLPLYAGMRAVSANTQSDCDIIESRSVYMLSNDDIYNLGHYINDVIMTWALLILTNLSNSSSLGKDSVLLNIDGWRAGGPAGGPAHRLHLKRRGSRRDGED